MANGCLRLQEAALNHMHNEAFRLSGENNPTPADVQVNQTVEPALHSGGFI